MKNRGSSLTRGGIPLMPIVAAAAGVVVCVACIGATMFVRSRRRHEPPPDITIVKTTPPVGDLSRSRSRSASRRRKSASNKAKGQYAAVKVEQPADDYATMPTASYRSIPAGEGGYRSIPVDDAEYITMPEVEGDDGYGTMPATSVRTSAYSSGTHEYAEMQRTRAVSPRTHGYATGSLGE